MASDGNRPQREKRQNIPQKGRNGCLWKCKGDAWQAIPFRWWLFWKSIHSFYNRERLCKISTDLLLLCYKIGISKDLFYGTLLNEKEREKNSSIHRFYVYLINYRQMAGGEHKLGWDIFCSCINLNQIHIQQKCGTSGKELLPYTQYDI